MVGDLLHAKSFEDEWRFIVAWNIQESNFLKKIK